jgi:hypothetical protein
MVPGTMKRKLKWLAIVLAVSLLGFGTALLLWPRDRITAESYEKIRIGMTEEEVAEILGGAGMTWQEHRTQYARLEKELGGPPFQIQLPTLEEPEVPILVVTEDRYWTGRRGMILLELDQDNRVCRKFFQGVRWTNGGVVDRLRDWLDW